MFGLCAVMGLVLTCVYLCVSTPGLASSPAYNYTNYGV